MDITSSTTETELAKKVCNLTIELEVAKESIQDLQNKLERRESELRRTKEKQERSFRRRTRQRKASGLFNGCFKSENNDRELQSSEEQLNGCLLLTICGYSTSHHDMVGSEDAFSNSPTFVYMVEGKMFVVGPEGATIGSGSGCGVKLPSETGIRNYHGCIKSRINATNGKTEFFFYKLMHEKYKFFDKTPEVIASTELQLHNGTTFLTGNVKWKVANVPVQYYLPSKAFICVRGKSTTEFLACMKEIKDWNQAIAKQVSEMKNDEEKSGLLQKQVDLCSEENFNYAISTDVYEGGAKEDSFVTTLRKRNQYTLLHVAVDHGKTDIVKILLETGFSVDMQCGSQKYTPLHLACKNNNLESVRLLLQFSACVDIKDRNSEVPVSVAEGFGVRKLLLRASLFCSACGEGDFETVQSVLQEEPVCLNVRGFRHYTPLQLASFYGHEDIVKFLLDKKASPNLTDLQYKRSALHFAVLSDNIAISRLLLHSGADPSLTDVFGYTALHFCQSKEMLGLLQEGQDHQISFNIAVQIGNMAVVQQLLVENQKENIPNSLPNHIVHKINSNECARKISRHVAMNNLGLCSLVDQKDALGLSPMHFAAAAGNMDILQVLCNHGGSVNKPGGIEKWTPLFYASLCGQYQSVEYLLTLGAIPEQSDTRGHHCVDLVEKEIKLLKVKLKIEDASSINTGAVQAAQDKDHLETSLQALIPPQFLQTSEHPCIDVRCESCLKIRLNKLTRVLQNLQSNQQKLLKILKDEDEETLHRLLSNKDVNLNVPLSKSLPITPLNYAASLGLENITEILLTYNADPYFADSQSYMPIHTAAECGYEQVIRVLLQDGVDVNVQTYSQKYTALHIAVLKSHVNVVKLLLSVEGIDVTLLDKKNKKPFDLATEQSIQYMLAQGEELLSLAVHYNDIEKLKAFLDTGVFNVNEICHEGISLLHVAATRNHEEVARMLIANGANVNAVASRDEETPLHCACRNSSSAVVDVLLKNGAELSMEDINGHTAFEVTHTNEIRKLILLRPKTATEQEQEMNMDEGGISMVTGTLENNVDYDDENKCRICMTNDVNTIVLPCGHENFCSECVLKIDTCSLDRRKIRNIVFTTPTGNS